MENRNKFNLYKFCSTFSIIGLFVCVALLILGAVQAMPITKVTFVILAIITILCLVCVCSLYWVKKLCKAKYKILSLVFLGALAICALLWIVSVILLTVNIDKVGSWTWSFAKSSVIITLQYIVADLVAISILKYKKRLLAFQIVGYTGCLFLDFCLTYLVSCVVLETAGEIGLSKHILLLAKPIMIALMVIAVLYIAIVVSIVRAIEFKRNGGVVVRGHFGRRRVVYTNNTDEDEQEEKQTSSVEEKIGQLNNLLKKNLITQEEYDKKKADIINNL